MDAARWDGLILEIGTTFRPSITIEDVSYSGGGSELAIWGPDGLLKAWLGTSGRSAAAPPAATGTLTLSVASGDTTVTGTMADTEASEANFSEGDHTYIWDMWDSAGNHDRVLFGRCTVRGREMP